MYQRVPFAEHQTICAQVSLCKCADKPATSLFTYIKYEDRDSDHCETASSAEYFSMDFNRRLLFMCLCKTYQSLMYCPIYAVSEWYKDN